MMQLLSFNYSGIPQVRSLGTLVQLYRNNLSQIALRPLQIPMVFARLAVPEISLAPGLFNQAASLLRPSQIRYPRHLNRHGPRYRLLQLRQ